MKKSIVLFAVSIEKLKNLKNHIFSKTHLLFLLFAVNVKMKRKKL